jgi:hypothetical protein
MARPEWRDPAKERWWRRLFTQFQRSGLTGRAFCARHRLSEPSFYAWRRELARRDRERLAVVTNGQAKSAKSERPSTGAFVQVGVDARMSAPAAIDLVLAQGRLLRIRPGFDADLLRRLLHVLEGPAC